MLILIRLSVVLVLAVAACGCCTQFDGYSLIDAEKAGELGVFKKRHLYSPYMHENGYTDLGTDRLHFAFGFYRAIWSTEEQDFIVLITESGGTLGFGTNYWIDVYDTDMDQVRSGIAEFLHSSTPYALVNVTATSDRLPESYDGQPRLAVAFVRSEINTEKPIWIRGFGSPERDENYADIAYVQWDDGVTPLPVMPRDISFRTHVQTIRLTSAEPGLIIDPDGKINVEQSSRGGLFQ